MVLQKETSILGYPGEVSTSMVADHHDVCKYTSRQDSNYISVRNVLKTLVGRFHDASNTSSSRSPEEVKKLQALLAVHGPPEDDLNFFKGRRMPGTCQWIQSDPAFGKWLAPALSSQVLWLQGLPASGKSIISTSVVEHLREVGVFCQFFFIRFGDQTKRSPSAVLRSLAYQIAEQVPAFRRKLLAMYDEGLRFERTDARTIWSKVFVSLLFKMELNRPFYWVVDALDESDSPRNLLDIMSEISLSGTPIRLLVVSRFTEHLSLAFNRLSNSTPLKHKSIEAQREDIHMFVHQEMKYLRGSEAFKEKVEKEILEKASGNFLWVTFAVTEVLQCYTEDDIERALNDIPSGMEPLYQRMENAVARNPRENDRALAKRVLTWVACCRRVMTVAELSQALEPEFPAVLDLERAIKDVCGGFVVVSNKNVAMIHQTARDYLVKTPSLQLYISAPKAHYHLFQKSLSFLLDPTLKAKLGQIAALPAQPFLRYAATSWLYHLNLSRPTSNDSLSLLAKFFRGPCVLTWIHSLGYFDQQKELVQFSKGLYSFVSRKRKLHADDIPDKERIEDLEVVELWAMDLVKLFAKFGPGLMQEPSSIYKLIPPFCPKNSIIFKQHGRKDMSPSAITMKGLANIEWDDCLAQVSVGSGLQALKLICTGRYFCVLVSIGVIVVFDAVSLKETMRISHEEYVFAIAVNGKGDSLVSYGYHTTKVWSLPSGRLESLVTNPQDCNALTLSFTENDGAILVGSEDKTIRRLEIGNPALSWQQVHPNLVKEESPIPGANANSPVCMAFSPDLAYIAVAYRGYPLSIWSLSEGRSIAKCRRISEKRKNVVDAWTGVDRVTWHPYNGEVLGLYSDGCVFRWHPLEEDKQEVRARASELECSSDGVLFITSDVDGIIKIWNYQHFALVYQLTCDNGITGLSFSPDSRRFYDLNGSTCNVWEPNVLIRLAETDDQASTKESEAASTILSPTGASSEVGIEFPDPITASAMAPCGSIYCYGNDEGLVELCHTSRGPVTEVFRSPRFLMIDLLTCNEDGSFLAFSELGGQVKVYQVFSIDVPSKMKCALTLEVKIMDGVEQLLFSSDAKHFLIAGKTVAQIWSLETASQIWSFPFTDDNVARRLINNPANASQFLAISADDLEIYSWDLLRRPMRRTISFSGASETLPDDMNGDDNLIKKQSRSSSTGLVIRVDPDQRESVKTATTTQDGEHILVTLETPRAQHGSLSSQPRQLFVIPVASLSDEGYQAADPIYTIFIPGEIESQIQIPLGILPQGRLVFLDHEYWMSTYPLKAKHQSFSSTDLKEPPNVSAALQKHFFMPRDWVSVDCLALCQVMRDGTFLCPHRGEIAIIGSGLGRAW